MRWAPHWALRQLRPDRSELGHLGEALAALHLERLGHRIRARRLRTAAAEVDLLSVHQGRWHCTEVKTGRSGPRFTPGARLSSRQLARLQRAAASIAREVQAPCQVDLIEVRLGVDGQLRDIRRRCDL